MRRRVAIGIDPGVSGGMVALWCDGKVDTHTLAYGAHSIWEWLAQYSPYTNDDVEPFAVVEQVGGYMGDNQGKNKAAAHTMFTLGTSCGMVSMALVGNGIPHKYVSPVRWQEVIGTPKKKRGEKQHKYKTRLQTYAKEMFPLQKVTKAVSDAFLVALYCARIRSIPL